MTTLAQLHQQFLDDFFSGIEPLHRENKNPSSFGYLAVKHGEEFALILNFPIRQRPSGQLPTDFDHEEQIFVIWIDAEATMCQIIALGF